MAFYLRRAFADDPAVHVFHNLRLEQDGDAAQIDHLVLHRSGAVLVESKSVTSAVRINERDEWTRQWNGRWTGMPSPVLQEKRQAAFLQKTLQMKREPLLGKAMFGLLQKGFQAFVFDVVVAISDQGVIQHRGQLPEVRKADQVADRVRELVREQTALAHPLSKDPRSKAWGVTLKPEEFVRVSSFLNAAHRDRGHLTQDPPVLSPIVSASSPTAGRHGMGPAPAARPNDQVNLASGPVTFKASQAPRTFTCQACSSGRLEVTSGKYSYYFKCLNCRGNTWIDLKCSSCGEKARTRKEGKEFFADCGSCSGSERYFTHPA